MTADGRTEVPPPEAGAAASGARRPWSIRGLPGVGLGAIAIFALAALLAWAAARPPSPLAAADRLIERALWRFAAPARPQSPDIVIIAIDDETLSLFPYRSPIDRAFVAQTITALAGSGVRAIGIDILLDQPTEAAKDQALRAALDERAVPTVLVDAAPETTLSPARRRFLDAFLAGRRSGYANLARDRLDDLIRDHVPRHAATGLPSFPAMLAQTVGVAAPDRPFAIAWRAAPSANATPFPIYPAEAVPALPRAWLAGRIALIGTFLPGQDEHRTPISGFGSPTYGVEIHAHVLSQLLDEASAGRSPEEKVEVVSDARMLTTGVLTAAGMAAAGALTVWALPVLVILGIGAWAGSFLVFAAGGPLLSPLGPTLGLALGASAVRFWRGMRERADRVALRQLFAKFVSEPVIEEIWKARSTFLAGGRPRPQELTATVLFSDIAGFTPICETLAPAPLVAWLETYIDAMVQIIARHDGVVLRFIGDGILAVFGAPIARRSEAEIARDARNAVTSARAMVEMMHRLNEGWRARGLPGASIRVGIQTGPLVAGSLGNGPRLEYCLLGDTANTAARLEALGKEHARAAGDDVILVGEPTWRLLAEEARGEAVGEVALKGKARKVRVYRIDAAT